MNEFRSYQTQMYPNVVYSLFIAMIILLQCVIRKNIVDQ